ncbi:hypothetical protein Tco_0358250, partial [Tanacetum coccineum]
MTTRRLISYQGPYGYPLAQAMDTPKLTFMLARPQYHPLNRPWIPA